MRGDRCVSHSTVAPDADAVEVHRRVQRRHLAQHCRVVRAAATIFQVLLRAETELAGSIAGAPAVNEDYTVVRSAQQHLRCLLKVFQLLHCR